MEEEGHTKTLNFMGGWNQPKGGDRGGGVGGLVIIEEEGARFTQERIINLLLVHMETLSTRTLHCTLPLLNNH